jgi:thioredoxin 1
MPVIESTTEAAFEHDVLATSGTTLVEFWAEWCGPCRAVTPVLEQLAAEGHADFRIVKINSDDHPAIAARYQVLAIPTMKVFRGGELVRTIIGAKPSAKLKAELAEYLG